MKSKLTPIDQALAAMLGDLSVATETETVALSQAPGRILAETLIAPVDVPPADNSAMDGYAVTARDTVKVPVTLAVTQRIAAGQVGKLLTAGSAARLFTGAPIPPGADAVVMQENARPREGEVEVMEPVEPGENIRRRGEDIRCGATLLEPGHRLGVRDLHLLAACGLTTLVVRRPLRVAILTTGSELVQPGRPLAAGQIYNSNYPVLAGLVQALGMTGVDFGIVADQSEATIEALRRAAEEADCIVTSGGVSVGEEDHVKAAVESLGSLDLWKLAIKPGKPFARGTVAGKPFFGLPGNPVSAFVTFCLMVRPALLVLAGAKPVSPAVYRLRAGFQAVSGERQEYLRVRVEYGAGADPAMVLLPNQSSGVGSSLSVADGLAILPAFTSVERGDILDFIPLNELIG